MIAMLVSVVLSLVVASLALAAVVGAMSLAAAQLAIWGSEWYVGWRARRAALGGVKEDRA